MYNIYRPTGTQLLCTVMAVDLKRKVCKCLSDTGESLSEVRWIVPMGGADGAGLSVNPIERSRVLVDTASGFPFIVGAVPIDGLHDVNRTNISKQGIEEEDIAEYSMVTMGDIIRGPGTPKDQRVGDSVITSDGGGLIGLLASGTAVIKSSAMAQMVFSRFGDLARLVSRNFEHFTDMDETYKTSIRGKLFSIRNIFRNPTKSRSEEPSFIRYEGDVAFGETLGKSYASIKEADFPTEAAVPEDSNLIIKEYTKNDENEITSTFTQSIDGSYYRSIEAPDGTSSSIYNSDSLESSLGLITDDSESFIKNTAAELRQEVREGIKTNTVVNETGFQWDTNEGKVSIKGTEDSVVIDLDGKTTITAKSDGSLSIVNSGDTTVNTTGALEVTAADTTFNLGNTAFNTGTFDITASGNATITAPMIALN